MNTIIIDGKQIKLNGFDKLKDKTTFAFYPKGISIFFEQQDDTDKPYYMNVDIKNHIIVNESLLEKLKERLSDGNMFLQSSNSYIQILI